MPDRMPMPPPTKWRMAITSTRAGRALRMTLPLERGTIDYAASSRMDELMLWMAHRQHRAGRFADDFLGDAAQQHMDQPGVAVRAHDDEVDIRFAGKADDLVKRRTFADLGMYGEAAQLMRVNEAVQSLADRRGELLRRRRNWNGTDGFRDEESQVLHDVQKIQLGVEFFGERGGVGERIFGVLAEIGGDENAVQVDHDASSLV